MNTDPSFGSPSGHAANADLPAYLHTDLHNHMHTDLHDHAHDHEDGPEGTHAHDQGLAFDLPRLAGGSRTVHAARSAHTTGATGTTVLRGGSLPGLPAIPGLDRSVERRDFVRLAIVGGAAAVASVGFGRRAMAQSATTTAACTDIPEETAGPYPGDGSNGPNVLATSGVVRRDIRSSFGSLKGVAEGVPLTITMTIMDTATCAPAKGYAVYLWHADREGRYSLYSAGATDQNYLRGVQETDTNGQVTFTSIFPACYDGRWPHIHYEVFPSLAAAGDVTKKIATSQIALPKATCDLVYATTGYSASVTNLSKVSLATDGIFSDDTTGRQVAAISGNVTAGFVATTTVSVSNSTKTAVGVGGGAPGGPGGGQPPTGAPGAPGVTTTVAATTKQTTATTKKSTATTKKTTAKKTATTKKKTAATKATTTVKK